jgi:predicted RecB family endonuclease
MSLIIPAHFFLFLEELLEIDDFDFQDVVGSSEFKDFYSKIRDSYNRLVLSLLSPYLLIRLPLIIFSLRIMKDYSQKIQVFQAQKEKALETVHKDIEGLNSRQRDLDKQLDSMQSKYKVLLL